MLPYCYMPKSKTQFKPQLNRLTTQELMALINQELHGMYMFIWYAKNHSNSELEVINIEPLPLQYY